MPVSHIYIRQTHMVGNDTPERIVAPGACPAMAGHRMGSTGLSDAGRGYAMARSTPGFSHLLLCYAGAGRVLIDGAWRTCPAGWAYLAPPGVAHAFQTVGRRRWKFCWMFFDQPAGSVPVVDCEAPILVRADPRPLRSSIEGLYRESIGRAAPDVMNHWAELAHVYAMRVVGPHRRTAPSRPADRLWRLWAEVDAELAADWSMPKLADRAAMSEEHVRRLCLRETGRSPMRQVAHLRLRRAAALLGSTPSKISAIARTVGYESPFAFSTAFKRIHGIAPAEFRSRRGEGSAV